MTTTVPTPEIDKMKEVEEESQIIGAFLDEMQTQGYRLMTYEKRAFVEPCRGPRDNWGDPMDICEDGVITVGRRTRRQRVERGDTCPQCKGEGTETITREDWYPHPGHTIEGILAAHFDIDLQKVSEEKDAILEAFRSAQEGQ